MSLFILYSICATYLTLSIWEYMKIYPDETNCSTIAKGAKVTRHTVAKHFEMIQKMLGIQKTAPHPLLDCQPVPLMV